MGQAQDAFGGRLIGQGRFGRVGAEYSADARQGGALVPGAQPAEVADFSETSGQNVEQKASHELLGGERHRLELVFIGAACRGAALGRRPVAPGEGDLSSLQRQDAMVGDGNAVGVAGEIVERMLGSGHGSLWINDPWALPEPVDECGPADLRGQVAGGVVVDQAAAAAKVVEPADEAGLEGLGERVLAEEITPVSALPDAGLGVPGAAGNQAMEVVMQEQFLRPGVEHGNKAELAPQLPLGIGGEVLEDPVDSFSSPVYSGTRWSQLSAWEIKNRSAFQSAKRFRSTSRVRRGALRAVACTRWFAVLFQSFLPIVRCPSQMHHGNNLNFIFSFPKNYPVWKVA